MILNVGIEKIKYYFDEAYSYAVPYELLEKVKIGSRVLVPFGKANTLRQGLILEIIPNQIDENLKKIHLVLDEAPLINFELLKIIKYLKYTCFCSFFEAYRCVLPPAINVKPEIIYKFQNYSGILLSAEGKVFLSKLLKLNKNIFTHSSISKFARPSLVANFLEKGILKIQNTLSKNSVGREFESVFLADNNCFKKLTVCQKNVYEFISEAKISPIKEICYFTGESIKTVQSMIKRGILGILEDKNENDTTNNLKSENILCKNEYVLSKEQDKVFEKLMKNYQNNKFSVELLYGVTGSGKTHVILKLIDYVLSKGKDIIFMVPEIALTSQFILIFRKYYGEKISIFHSGLSHDERFLQWNRVRKGEAKIAIGTRSAVFAPLKNLGLIILDEEHEYTYKSEQSPRFHARNVSEFRCNLNNCMLLLSSATPSIESYFNVKNIHFLKNRFGNANLPNVKIIDMNKSYKYEMLSQELIDALKQNKKEKKQSVLLMNRRGFNTLVRCRNCGEVALCPKCNISLNFHKDNNFLMCHYCGYCSKIFDKCTKCGSDKIGFFGIGTQKIEEKLKALIPGVKILRMDADAVYSKKSYSRMFLDFGNGNYDILLGTQMIAKGLDFPNVTLVGVISADQFLYSDDFRSCERAFSLITQVVGRCGRKNFKGKAWIQTYTPENLTIKMAADQNYENFFCSEINLRRSMLYPPFSNLCAIKFSGENEEKVKKICEDFFNKFKVFMNNSQKKIPLRILFPTADIIKKIAGKYRYKIILKCKNNMEFRETLSEFLKKFCKNNSFLGINLAIDMNFA